MSHSVTVPDNVWEHWKERLDGRYERNPSGGIREHLVNMMFDEIREERDNLRKSIASVTSVHDFKSETFTLYHAKPECMEDHVVIAVRFTGKESDGSGRLCQFSNGKCSERMERGDPLWVADVRNKASDRSRELFGCEQCAYDLRWWINYDGK